MLFSELVDHLPHKEMSLIIGPRQAGKTTLMKILSPLIRPTVGRVLIDGADVEDNPTRVKENIGCVVNDERSFFWRLTGRQNLPFFATLNNIPKSKAAETIERLVELVGLTPDFQKPFQNYSSGMKQKLAIARALLKKPQMLIMDEATSGLDNKSQARIQNLLDAQWKGRCTLIAVVHRLDIIKNYDKVAVMKGGKIVEMGTYDELIDKKGILYELVTGRK